MAALGRVALNFGLIIAVIGLGVTLLSLMDFTPGALFFIFIPLALPLLRRRKRRVVQRCSECSTSGVHEVSRAEEGMVLICLSCGKKTVLIAR